MYRALTTVLILFIEHLHGTEVVSAAGIWKPAIKAKLQRLLVRDQFSSGPRGCFAPVTRWFGWFLVSVTVTVKVHWETGRCFCLNWCGNRNCWCCVITVNSSDLSPVYYFQLTQLVVRLQEIQIWSFLMKMFTVTTEAALRRSDRRIQFEIKC